MTTRRLGDSDSGFQVDVAFPGLQAADLGDAGRHHARFHDHGAVVELAAVKVTAATGVPPAADGVCDGVDEDCDGLTDEDYAGGCGTGACRRSGVCAAGAGELSGAKPGGIGALRRYGLRYPWSGARSGGRPGLQNQREAADPSQVGSIPIHLRQ